MKIVQENGPSKGAFLAMDDNYQIGEMTYFWSGNNRFIIDHTEVDEEYQGRGIGKQLIEKAVEFARENNYRIYPVCPFAVSIFNETPAFNDVLTQ